MKSYPNISGYKPFLSQSQLSQLRKLAFSGMPTEVTVLRRQFSDDAYGDDENVSYSPVLKTRGWLFSRTSPVQEMDIGSLITSSNFRLYLYVGTDVRIGDKVVIHGGEYIVSDTTAESTWQALMVCSLRKRD